MCGWARLRTRLRPRKEGPLSLALLRVVVPLIALAAPGFRAGRDVSRLSPATFVVPEGLGWFVAVVPIHPTLALVAQAVAVFGAVCAALGVATRAALVALAFALFYLYAVAQLTGFVWHDMHILWMVALLAASPCGDAMGFDAGFRATRPPSLDYAQALWGARALLACVYFFPGLFKVLTQGLGWALSDNLRNQLWWKWAEHGVVSPSRIDRVPGLLSAGGLAVLIFELGFPLFILSRRARPFVAVAGVLFHLSAQVVFMIPFLSLIVCYVVLVDVDALAQLASRRGRDLVRVEDPAPRSRRALWAHRAVAVALVGGAFVQGARRQMQSYPFACYPTFQWNPGTLMPDLEIEALTADGRTLDVEHARDVNGRRSQRDWGTVWSVAGVTTPTSPALMRAYWESHAAPPRGARVVRLTFFRVLVSVDPDKPKSIASRQALAALTLRDGAGSRPNP